MAKRTNWKTTKSLLSFSSWPVHETHRRKDKDQHASLRTIIFSAKVLQSEYTETRKIDDLSYEKVIHIFLITVIKINSIKKKSEEYFLSLKKLSVNIN